MIALRFEALAGRIHATPWDAHVNEGQVEWPPSPWRVLRALVAASWKLPARDDGAVRALVSRLADELPTYRLPATTEAHVRAYLAQQSGRDGRLVFDAFALVDPADPWIDVVWRDVVLSGPERDLLGALAAQVGYLGRAEAWVHVEVADALPDRRAGWAEPAEGGEESVLAPATEEAFRAWREGFLAGGGKKKDVPATRYDALATEVSALQKDRWSAPPGARRVSYRCTEAPPARRPGRTAAPPVRAVRYALTGKVLPRVERTIVLAERVRLALMSRLEDADALRVFSGHAPDGSPLLGNRHAYYLPCDDDGDGFLDHVIVWSPEGFSGVALERLRGLRSLWAERGATEDGRYALTLVGAGDESTLGGADPRERRLRSPLRTGVLGASSLWRSETPFVPFRHPKRKGGAWRDLPAEQVVRALGHLPHLEGVAPPRVRIVGDEDRGERAVRWARGFLRTRREGGGSLGSPRGEQVELSFEAPVAGPILLGYGAHFGMGCFRAVEP